MIRAALFCFIVHLPARLNICCVLVCAKFEQNNTVLVIPEIKLATDTSDEVSVPISALTSIVEYKHKHATTGRRSNRRLKRNTEARLSASGSDLELDTDTDDSD